MKAASRVRVLVTAVLAGLCAMSAGIAAPARASTQICVALVVDFTAFGGNVDTTCAHVTKGSSGSDVLTSAHKVTFDPRYGNDFVCAIDGVPANGCHGVDNTHYWAYYHRAPGSSTWQISNEGAGTYEPANASSEGWVYDNGDSNAPQPKNVPFPPNCRAATTSTTVASRSPSPTAAPPTRPSATTPRPSPSPTPVRSTPSKTHLPDVTSPNPVTTMSVGPPSPSTTPVAIRAPHPSGRGIPWTTLGGVAAAVAIGLAAWMRAKRGAG